MSEQRFVYGVIKGSRQAHIKDCHNCKSATIDVYDDDFKYFVDKLNEQQAIIDKLDQENADLLGARIRAQEEWEKCTDKLKAKILEQQDLIEVLYDFRLTYNALLFNEWAENQKYEVYKSRKHGDGELCFDGEYFIVVAQLPTGQVTNHYHIRHWDMFKIKEYEKAKEEFDGHTSSDVIERLQQVIDV